MKINKKIINLALSFLIAILSISVNNSYAIDLFAGDEIIEEYVGEMQIPKKNFAVEIYKDKVYVLGGVSSRANYKQEFTMEIYDLATGTWSKGKDIPVTYPSRFTSNMITTLYKSNIYVLSSKSILEIEILKYDIEKDEWSIETSTNMKTAHNVDYSSMTVYNNTLYIIASYYDNVILKYNLDTKEWSSIESTPPKKLQNAKIIPYENKIYCFGSFSTVNTHGLNVCVYNLETNEWSLTSPMQSYVNNDLALRQNDDVYMLHISGSYSKIHKYSIKEDIWTNTRTSLVRDVTAGEGAFVRDGYLYRLGGWEGDNLVSSIYRYKISNTSSREELADYILTQIEKGDYSQASQIREIICSLPNTPEKESLLERYEMIKNNIPDMPLLEKKNISSNLDIYIKSQNMLSLSLDTNVIDFMNYSGVEDMEKANAVNLTISSSLPYSLSAYMPTEIANSDKSKTLPIDILNIKESSELDYKQFTNTTDKIVLKDNCIKGNDIVHSLDLKISSNQAHQADVYKTTIKLEAEQK